MAQLLIHNLDDGVMDRLCRRLRPFADLSAPAVDPRHPGRTDPA